jgi:hypothetical protein
MPRYTGWKTAVFLTIFLGCGGEIDTRTSDHGESRATAPASSQLAATCPTFWVIGVRGSGQPLAGNTEIEKMGGVVSAYVQRTSAVLPAADTEYLSLPYPAASVGPDYFDSEEQGWESLQAIIRGRVDACPGIRIGLVGYSQGAHVVNDALHFLERSDPGALDNVRAALLIADPRADATARYHLPVSLSGDPAPAPQHGGVLTPQTLPGAVQDRAVSFCISGDLVCDAPDDGFALLVQAVLLPIHTDGYQNCCTSFFFVQILGDAVAQGLLRAPPNRPPRITTDHVRVTATVGQDATNAGDVTDPDGDTVSVTASAGTVVASGGRWTWSETVTTTDPQTITIDASDPSGETRSVSFTVNGNAQTNRPPVASAGPDETVECSAQAGTPVTLNGSDSSDPDGDALTFRWTGPFGTVTGRTPTVTLPDGASTITLTVTDEVGASATDSVVITVADTQPPTIQSASADPATLSPPNHRMVPVAVSVTATDVCSPTVSCAISQVTSNEPVDGTGDSHTSPDWTITGDLTVDLRAERAGSGNGRVYTITVRCVDESGNAATAPVEVRVPHN